ncbi:MAG: sarcosine oxidase subunit delta [Nitrospinota bacterium]
MSFLIPCPHCGPRGAYEFRFGGEVQRRPAPDAPDEEWTRYTYLRVNRAGPQVEWWFHRDGCRAWFLAERDTVTNRVFRTFWAEEGLDALGARAPDSP